MRVASLPRGPACCPPSDDRGASGPMPPSPLGADRLRRGRRGAAGGGARRAAGRRAAAVPARARRSRSSRARFLNPSLDHLHDPMALADMGVAVDRHPRRDRAQGADRDPRRLRRRRHHVHRHPAPRARAARRRRRALHPRAAEGRLRPAAGGRSSGCTPRASRSSSRWTAAFAAPTRRAGRASSAST